MTLEDVVARLDPIIDDIDAGYLSSSTVIAARLRKIRDEAAGA